MTHTAGTSEEFDTRIRYVLTQHGVDLRGVHPLAGPLFGVALQVFVGMAAFLPTSDELVTGDAQRLIHVARCLGLSGATFAAVVAELGFQAPAELGPAAGERVTWWLAVVQRELDVDVPALVAGPEARPS